jgi:hypothetical protein
LPSPTLPPTVTSTPLCDASDPAQVVAPQRISLLTSTQLMNMIRLVSDAAAQEIIDGAVFDVTSDFRTRFPPAITEQFRSIPDATTLSYFSITAQKVGEYVRDNFATVTSCASATDACATTYLDSLARKAYRRPLTPDEKERFSDLYAELTSQIVNDQQVTLTVPEATGFAVQALLLSPQLLWRWELGGETASSPPGVYLTETELASSLSFFLTDRPPDDALAADADAGTLRAHLPEQVNRILKTQVARDWLTHVMHVYFRLNQLPGTIIDESKFPIASSALYSDLETESRMFLADVMWNGKVGDLLTSRKTFLNSNLATMIYGVAAPPGATPTSFVATTLPADERAGMLTNAGFLTTRARATGTSLVARGLGVKEAFTCIPTPPPPATALGAQDQIDASGGDLDMLTAQEQVAYRAAKPACSSCHATFDPYGLALEWYDVVGRYRTLDDLGMPVDGHTTLPAEVGGTEVQNAIELADVLSKTDVFTNCLATSVLDYALIDAFAELPLPSQKQRGCAAAGIAHALRVSSGRSFTDLFRAIAASPAFLLRTVEATAASGPTSAGLARAPSPRGDSFGAAAAPAPADAVLANLASRRSTLSFVARELDLLRIIGPADVRARLDNHFDAVLAMENSLTTAIDTNFPKPTGAPAPAGD